MSCAGAGPVWPEAYQSVNLAGSETVLVKITATRWTFTWLQWLAYTQFAACWAVCQGYMPITCIAIWR